MKESDEIERRVRRNLRFAEQLDQKRVWGLDDPAVREVLLDPVALRLLDVVRRSTEPIAHADLFETGLGSPASIGVRLGRLESLGMIRFDRSGPTHGFRAVDRILAVFCGESEEEKGFYDRYWAMVTEFNDSLRIRPVDHQEENFYADLIQFLTEEERDRVEEAIHRVLRECRRIGDEPRDPASEDSPRTATRILIRKSELDFEGPTLAPVLLFREDSVGSSRRILASMEDRLTPRQLEVATLIVAGATGVEIAGRLGVSENTVKSTVRAIYKKLDVSSKADFIRLMTE